MLLLLLCIYCTTKTMYEVTLEYSFVSFFGSDAIHHYYKKFFISNQPVSTSSAIMEPYFICLYIHKARFFSMILEQKVFHYISLKGANLKFAKQWSSWGMRRDKCIFISLVTQIAEVMCYLPASPLLLVQTMLRTSHAEAQNTMTVDAWEIHSFSKNRKMLEHHKNLH